MAWVLDEKETSTRTPLKNGDVLGREGTIAFRNMVQMSRSHCKIIIENDVCYVMDMGSKNGTMLDGRKIQAHLKTLVRDGSALAFGDKIVYLRQSDKTSTQVTAARELKLEEPRVGSAASPAAAAAQLTNPAIYKVHTFSFNGNSGEMFGLIIKNLIFTILSIGLYIPWARINIRRYIWKSTSLDKKPFQFRGNPKSLLKGYLIVLGGLVVLQFIENRLGARPGHINTTLMLFILARYLLFFFAYMKIKWNSYCYLVNNTAYRNIGFRANKKTEREFIKQSIPLILTFGLYYPWWLHKADVLRWKNTSFGNKGFEYSAVQSEFIRLWLTGTILSIVTFGLYTPWFTTSLHRYRMQHLKFMGASFQSKADGAEYFVVLLKSIFIIIISLGTAAPYVMNLNLAYFFKNLSLKGAIDFNQIIESMMKAQGGSAFDSAADVLDIDSGLDLL